MNKIYITYALIHYQEEFNLIERLLKYEGYNISVISPEKPEFKKYYKGGHPAILIYNEIDKDPTVLYGFWKLAEFMLKNTLLRC